MQLNLETHDGQFTIQSYQPGTIIINQQPYHQSVLISRHQLITDWQVDDVTQLNAEKLMPIIQQQPEIFLLGTGQQQAFLSPSLLSLFYQQGIGVEMMNTRAACRTFSILLAEGRNVIAGLILGDKS